MFPGGGAPQKRSASLGRRGHERPAKSCGVHGTVAERGLAQRQPRASLAWMSFEMRADTTRLVPTGVVTG
jgi:hypothetical protein